MRLSPAHLAVLDMAAEDYYALYEIPWGLRDLLVEHSEPELRRVAQETVRELEAEGLVALYHRIGMVGEEIPLPSEEVKPALDVEDNWNVPTASDTAQILILATKLGEQAYYSAYKAANLDEQGKSESILE